MKYLVCEMQSRWNFEFDQYEFYPVGAIQLVYTRHDAELLVSKLNEIQGVCEESGEKRYYGVEAIVC